LSDCTSLTTPPIIPNSRFVFQIIYSLFFFFAELHSKKMRPLRVGIH
jgi:hypothetical protein